MTASKETQVWWKRVLGVVVEEVAAKLKEQNARIAALEDRIAEFKYRGIWQSGIVYRECNSVTDNGSLWICMARESTQRPGNGSDWRLAVKRGKDGKDVRP